MELKPSNFFTTAHWTFICDAVWSSPRAKQNIYLTSTGKCYCYEFIEGNSVSFGANGEMISNSFVETGTSTNKFLLTQTMSFNELVEGALI